MGEFCSIKDIKLPASQALVSQKDFHFSDLTEYFCRCTFYVPLITEEKLNLENDSRYLLM